MDPNTVVLEISSDEDGDWNDRDGSGFADGGDDCNWLAELLDEVSKQKFGDDSDEVVVVDDVSPVEGNGKKSALKSCLIDLDDDCVVLENDPDKPMEVRNDHPSSGNEDSDDIIVVSEKGKVACRDYPHSRHLCIKFSFSTTPHQSHCEQCYCYVCDSLAPCVYWGNGSLSTDHCHATDKDESWILKRRNAKNGSKGIHPVPKIADASLINQLPPMVLQRPARAVAQPQNQILRHGSIHAHRTSASYQPPSVNHIRSPMVARNKFHPNMLSQMLQKGRPNYNIGATLHRPVFKRTGSVGAATTASRQSYDAYMGNFRNPIRQQNCNVNEMLSGSNRYLGSLQPNAANNTSVTYPSQTQNHTSSTVNLNHQPLPPQPQSFNHSNLNLPSQVNSNPFPENPISQPHLVQPSSSRTQLASCQPSYMVPAQSSYPVYSQSQVHTPSISVSDYTQNFPEDGNDSQSQIDSSFKDCGFSWPPTQNSATVEGGAVPTNESPMAAVSGGLADYGYDWIFDNQPVEPGFMDIPGPYGSNEFSSDSAYIDTGPIFDF